MSDSALNGQQVVLVADDNRDIRELVKFRLGRAGYSVLLAADGAEAVAAALEHKPVLAVLDVSMPKLTGYEVAQRIRADATTAGISIILLSANVQEKDISKGFASGADDYVRKPFSPDELLARIQAVLGRR